MSRAAAATISVFAFGVALAPACALLTSCNRPHPSAGERLARTYCAACHAFPEPRLLDKKTWESGVLPQMAPRLGVGEKSLYNERFRNPQMVVLDGAVSEDEWAKIVAYYRASSPDSLPYQSLPAEPQLDPAFFRPEPFAARVPSSGIITMLKTDTIGRRIFVGEGGSNALHIFDFGGRLLTSVTLGSPPTDVILENGRALVLESGILDPNDEPKGSLVQYDLAHDSLRFAKVLIDSLYRPVFAREVDFDGDGVNEIVICEYGNNRGRLALYKFDGSRYRRRVLDPSPGAIRFELRDMTGDGAPDIVALMAQGDERIEMFENDGDGNFTSRPRILARFPPVYGSMYFSMHDFNGDGKLDIVYVNGDNFDYSRVLKPYHGVRILENDGKNNFHERYFFPVYGAARAEVADFDGDGDFDLMVTSNFADFQRHPERGIVFLENSGGYRFHPYVFTIAAANQWNLTATADVNHDGRLDIIVGAMNLGNIAKRQQRVAGQPLDTTANAILLFDNQFSPVSKQ